ncbi:TPA: GatB/YqeY domain-containing protein [Vibrio parahaemolyticus]|uniref:GatB/YqeY domain-containing protein n=1 Tax=Vibrio parahaemolyticus TaxID=670 RepID=A0AAW8Q832_VIBPH|nr:GatB/YqeY domain-containing protein [Vibrio parahaemolyticus]MDS1823859.1 GatB/YqeY domain-containing protein [Vibrio parahaemolyticus]
MLTLETLKQKRFQAIKERNKVMSVCLSTLIGELQTSEKDGNVITEATIVKLINKHQKTVESNISDANKAGRQELIPSYETEIEALKKIAQASSLKDLTDTEILSIVEKVGATEMKDMKLVMAELNANYAGRFNAGKASGLIKQALMK